MTIQEGAVTWLADSRYRLSWNFPSPLALTMYWLYKAELIPRHASGKTKAAEVGLAALGWVASFTPRRLLELFGSIPSAEADANYSRLLAKSVAAAP